MSVLAQKTRQEKEVFYYYPNLIKSVKNYNEQGKLDGEQKFYTQTNGKNHYQYLFLNAKNDEIVEFKFFDDKGKVIGEYKKNMYLKSDEQDFKIKDGKLSGKGKFDGAYIEIINGRLNVVVKPSNIPNHNNICLFEKNHLDITEISTYGDVCLEYKSKFLPFSVDDKKELKPLTFTFNERLESLEMTLGIDDIISAQTQYSIYDSLFTISKLEYNRQTGSYDKILKEERFYENGLLMWKMEYNKNNYEAIYTMYEYKRTIPLDNEHAIKKALTSSVSDGLRTSYRTYSISLSKDDYIETYEAYDKQKNIVASTELDKGIALQKQAQKETANKIVNLLIEFNKILKESTGAFFVPSDIETLFRKIDQEYANAINRTAYGTDEYIPIKAEQAELYQLAINVIKKVGVKEFNKVCKGIKTKEELMKYLNSIK